LKTLLVVDDDNNVRALVRMALEGGGYQIIEASQGGQALKLARQYRPELVLLDVALPDISGLQVCRVMRSDPDLASILVIMLTAMTQPSDFGEGDDAGADDYVTKPFSPGALARRVEAVLGAANLRRAPW
jgi:DNA-binding response OmpR family regulator